MQKCPHCKGLIQDGAQKCKHCRKWIEEPFKNQEGINFSMTKKNIKIIAGLIIVLVIVGFFIFYLNSNKQPQNIGNISKDEGISKDELYKAIVKIEFEDTVTKNKFLGSGIIFSKDGLIITNNHVVENENFGTAQGNIKVCITKDVSQIPDCKYDGVLVVRNPEKDLAIIQIKGDYKEGDFLSIFNKDENANSFLEKQIKVLGFPSLGGDKLTVTKGIISGFDDNNNLKTDTEINHGNSGGGSFDEQNNFIGIPSFIISESSGKIGYIIPKSKVKDWVKSLLGSLYPSNNILFKSNFEGGNIAFTNGNVGEDGGVNGTTLITKFALIETNKNDYEGNIKTIGEILKIRPTAPLAYQYLGDAYTGLKNYDSALIAYKYSFTLDPYNVYSILGYGICLSNLNRDQEAVQTFEDLIGMIDENDTEKLSIAYNSLGVAYSKIGNIDSAKKYYSLAVQENPNNDTATTNLNALGSGEKSNNFDEFTYGNNACINSFGPGGIYSGNKNTNGNYLCECKEGYSMNLSVTYCLKKIDNNYSNSSDNQPIDNSNTNTSIYPETAVLGQDVNLRTFAGTNSNILQQILKDESVTLIDEKYIGTQIWYNIMYKGIGGWISGVGLIKDDDVQSLTDYKKLYGYWFTPHSADINITFLENGRFTFNDFNSTLNDKEVLTGNYILQGEKLTLNYDDRPSQLFRFYKGNDGDENYYITNTSGYYFVKQ